MACVAYRDLLNAYHCLQWHTTSTMVLTAPFTTLFAYANLSSYKVSLEPVQWMSLFALRVGHNPAPAAADTSRNVCCHVFGEGAVAEHTARKRIEQIM